MAKITMGGLLTPARVIPRLKAHDKAQVIRELARSASHSACVEESVVHEATKICANSPSFGPGRRVAIPHAVVKGIDNALGIFARLQPAIAFGALDGEPVDLVLLVLAPEGSPGLLLRAMACGARCLRDREVRESREIRRRRGGNSRHPDKRCLARRGRRRRQSWGVGAELGSSADLTFTRKGHTFQP